MKSSALALVTAAALIFGATSVSFAQETTTRPASEAECAELAAEGTEVPAAEADAANTDTSASLSASSESDDEESAESGEGDAIDDQSIPDCPVTAQ